MNTQPLPHNEISERYVLGRIFNSAASVTELTIRGFSPQWLYIPKNRLLWESIINFRSRQQSAGTVDIMAFSSWVLNQKDMVDEIGGMASVSELFTQSYIEGTLDFHVEELKTCYQRRRSILLASKLEASAYDGEDFDGALASTITELGTLSAVPAADRIVNGRDALKEFVADLIHAAETGHSSEAPALKSQIAEIDDKVGGMVPYFWLIGADTSGGKTAFSLQLVRAILEQGGRVLVFALEMRARQLVRRIVAAEGKIPIQRLMRPETLIAQDHQRLTGPGVSWKAENLLICDDGDVTIQEVRAIARAQHAQEPLACVLVDYIQLASAGRFKDGANREQEISFIGSQCVKMAKELGVPVIAPTQLNDDGKVRESRALKHHAAVYLVIEKERILCAKNRDGERDWDMQYKLKGDIQTFLPEGHHEFRN